MGSDYYSRPGVNWSRLRILWKGSPLHYKHATEHPEAGDTPSRVNLRAIHCAALEPDRWATDYAPYDGTRRGKAWAAWQEEHPGVEGLTRRAWEEAQAIADALHAHPLAGPLLTGDDGASEVPMGWVDADTDLLCKGLADRLITTADGRRLGVDLKTVGSVDADEITRMIWRLGWHGQAAHYTAGGGLDGFALVVVEQAAPHDVAVFWFDPQTLAHGEALRRRLLRQVADCDEADSWPGRYAEEQTLALPHWVEPIITDTRSTR